MSPLEFVFSLFGLVLGFSLVEVLSGLVKTVKLRGKVRIGWLVPLLGFFVMVDLTSFWSIAWVLREKIPANYAVLLLGLTISGLYYFSASMVFPDKPEEWPDFDAWAAAHKRQVMGGIFASNLMATAAVFSLLPPAAFTTYLYVTNGGLLAAMLASALVKPHWATGVLLAAMLAFYFWSSLLPLLMPT
jgi:hypothetical protein